MPNLLTLGLYCSFTNSDFLDFQEISTLSCIRFLAVQEGENSCAGAPTIEFQLGKRPKSVGWMVWTGQVFE